MKLAYDEKSRGLFIDLMEDGEYAESHEVAEGVVVDFDRSGRALRIELEDADAVVDVNSVLSIVKPRIRSGKDLRSVREGLGLTQQQLGDALGVPRNTIARWERDELQIERPRMLELSIVALTSHIKPRELAQSVEGKVNAFREEFKVDARESVRAAKVAGATRYLRSSVTGSFKTVQKDARHPSTKVKTTKGGRGGRHR